MEWTQFIIFMITIAGMFFWNRSESRQDIRHVESQIESSKMLVFGMIKAIHDEMKDFHGRLCDMEARMKK